MVLTYNSHREEAEAVAAQIHRNGGKAVAVRLDAAQIASLGDFVEEISLVLEKEWSRGDFDYLINNAGMAQRSLIKDTTGAIFDQLTTVNLKSSVLPDSKATSTDRGRRAHCQRFLGAGSSGIPRRCRLQCVESRAGDIHSFLRHGVRSSTDSGELGRAGRHRHGIRWRQG